MLKKLTPHAAIILSAMYLVFFAIDRVNRSMAFINNDITKWLLLILCGLSVYHAVLQIREDRQKERARQEQLRRARRMRSNPPQK